MSEYSTKLDLEEEEPSILSPMIFLESGYPSVTPLRSNFSGVPYLYGEKKGLTTLNAPNPESLVHIIELENSEVDEILKKQSFLTEVLKEKGIQGQEIEKMNQALLEYVETKAQMKQLELTDDVKRSLINLMVLIAKKLSEET